MMNKNRTIEEIFRQARQTQPTQLYSIQQVEAMLSASNAQPQGKTVSLFTKKGAWIGVASSLVVAGIIAASWEAPPPTQVNRISQQQHQPGTFPNVKHELSQPSAQPQPSSDLKVLQNEAADKARQQKIKTGSSNFKQKWNFSADNSTLPHASAILQKINVEQSGNANQSTNQDSILGIQKIQLTQEELNKIGLVFDGTKILIRTESGYGNQFKMTTISIDSKGYYYVGTEHRDSPSSSITPMIVASHWNQGINTYKSFLHFPDKSSMLDSLSISQKELEREAVKFNNAPSPERDFSLPKTINDYPKLSKLIPIYIRIGSSDIEGTNKKYGADIYLWYYPTPEFVAALPNRYRIPLQQELDVITDVVECKMPVGQVCERITGEKTFFDFCRKSSGSIAMVQAYPNPASNQVTCRYQLTNQRSVTITLHELSGKFLRELMAQQSVTAGIHEPELQLRDIPPGAYLIAVKTNTGDQAVQRIIVQQ
ncbi:MAG: T9SS type A sorting domain-containing protein [Armatimonadetes bacterium]|nr:T9SS type A sorting domain-containing protein [Armatimonadota bacterium]